MNETYEEPTIVEMEGEAEATAPDEKRSLTNEEKHFAKAEKKVEKERIKEEKIAAKIAWKEAKALEKKLRKEEKMLAKLLKQQEQELELFEDPMYDTGFDIAEDPAFSMMQDFQADIIGAMMDSRW